ncbi:MAG: aldehyde ferredoxin oxidoreductase family protein [Desulfurococcales archaeon]|nr:aldehyde ferredoxin oxidoreductase family protein [Desulfurococcales archaeon]
MARAWFWGKGLIVELDHADVYSVRERLVEDGVYAKLLGGRGLAVKMWIDALDGNKGIPQPLGADNPLVIAPGSLVGSGLSTASKTAVVARSPLTGFLGRSMTGGRLGLELRRVGVDFLVIRGALETPGLLVLDDEGARVERAKDLWGLRIGEARARISERFRGYATALIGPAGENLSRIAMIDFDGRQAGRTGLGAVLGSKMLKGIAVKGSRTPIMHDASEARRLARELNKLTSNHPASKALVEYGTPVIMDYTEAAYGVFPSLNWRRSTLSWCPDRDSARSSLSRFAPSLRKGRNPCVGCARPCSQVVEVEGRVVDGPEYETVYALGSNIGLCDAKDVAKLNYLADELGFDTISLGVTIAWALDAGERGIIEGAPRWGDLEAIEKLIEDMAYRRGHLGRLLADGVKAAVESLGEHAARLAIHVKGLELPAYDARGLKGMALGYAVSSRGGDHLTSGAYAVELPGRLWVFEGIDRLATRGKGVLVKQMEDLMGFYDATGICKFSRYTLHPENVAPFWEAVTGIRLTPGDLLRAGERAVNIERLVNLWLGLKPDVDDDLPPRLKSERISDGPSKGEVVREDELELMKSEYYAARGWSSNGIPLRSTLIYLDLMDLLPEHIVKLSSSTP